jgi:hypothetical protein
MKIFAFALLPGAVLLSGCAIGPHLINTWDFYTVNTWDFYTACEAETTFPALADCAKARRLAYCQQATNCNALGAAFVEYADALAAGVRQREISDAEARRRFAEFKLTQMKADVRLRMQAAAVAASSGPTVCNTVSRNTTICN